MFSSISREMDLTASYLMNELGNNIIRKNLLKPGKPQTGQASIAARVLDYF